MSLCLNWFLRLFLGTFLLLSSLLALADGDTTQLRTPYQQDSAVLAWVNKVVSEKRVDKDALMEALAKVKDREKILNLMDPSILRPDFKKDPRKKHWRAYLKNVLDRKRIQMGREFLQKYKTTFDAVEAQYGVPREVIAAIIGVETRYGDYMGKFSVFDTLVVLSFDYPARSSYFIKQLEGYLDLCQHYGWGLRSTLGSFAGAIGMPQFMPTSIQDFAADFDQDGKIDLIKNPKDAIASVGRFLNLHGWTKGLPGYYPTAFVSTYATRELVSAKPVLLSAGELNRYEIDTSALPYNVDAGLVDLPNETDNIDDPTPTDYLLGTTNFFVVTKYNRSFFYAASVLLFADELKK
jgi:membrane-bound lytic murein transglycosylase B